MLSVYSDDISGKAYAIEKGRRPGKGVPSSALIPWVRRHGLASGDKAVGVAIAISMSIKREGLPRRTGTRPAHGLHLFERALKENRARINQAQANIERRIAQALNG